MYLVSVGTTKFDGLVEAADNLTLPGGLFQIADGEYVPKNHDYLRYTDNFGELIDRADFVIAHAGVGVLFESLQRDKKVVCAPNMERSDKHQIEIAEELNLSAPSVTEMVQKLSESGYIEYTPYHGVALTDKGRTEALRIIRRHQLLFVSHWVSFLQ